MHCGVLLHVCAHAVCCCATQAEVDGSNWDDSHLVAPMVELSLRGWDNKPAKNTTARLMEEVLDGGAALMLLNGDISYARGCASCLTMPTPTQLLS